MHAANVGLSLVLIFFAPINGVHIFLHMHAVLHKPVGDGDKWFYFTPRERRYKNGKRPKRSTEQGYWKATGTDKEIKFEDRTVGFRKALVFYRGSPPTGKKTDWIMHEYRVSDPPQPTRTTQVNHDWVSMHALTILFILFYTKIYI